MISKRRQISHGCLAMALFLLLSMILSITASAAENDSDASVTSLTVVDQAGDEFIVDAPFQLYRVADVTNTGDIAFVPAFEAAGVTLSASGSADSWAAAASTLESYVVAQTAGETPIAPAATAQTDENGVALFADMADGLYLLVGSQVTVGQTVYTPSPMLITLPAAGNYGVRNEPVTVHVKNSSRTVEETFIDLSVLKVWKDDGKEAQRPAQVTITLYGDDEEFDTVTLSADNNWSYTWQGLSESVRWHVAETDVPEGYTVTTVQDGTTFVVTNTYAEETPAPSTTPTPTTTATPKLPQTGQLWWPITLLAMCGLVVILLGLGLRKRGSDHHEAK
jgi:LPXTG-motif cell wall-anchored protein